MNPEVNIEQAVRAALGDLTLQLIAARAENEALKKELAARMEAPQEPPKVNGKGKEPRDEAQSRSQ